MPVLTYTLSNFQRTNMDYKPGNTFTATATGTSVSNATLNSATLYFSAIMTWSTQLYMTFNLNGATGTTASTFIASTKYHEETVALTAFSQSLLTTGSGTVTFTVQKTGSWNQTIFNVGVNSTGSINLTYTLNYSQCTAPTSVSVSANNVAPGANVTLSWSGAKAGNGMSISQYQIYRATSATGTYSLLTTVSSTATSGSASVAAPTTSGSSYYYKIVTVGSVSGYNSAQSSVYGTLTCSFSAPAAPSTVTIGGASSTYATSGANVTLAWSGAAAGTNNAITGYIIYRNGASYQTVNSTATSGSLSVPAHATAGSSYYYAVYTKGTHSNSAVSASRYVYTYAAPTAPTSFSASSSSPDAGTNVTLSWSGAAAGSYNAITGYEIHRATSATGAYTLLATVNTTAANGSASVTAHATMGASYYYKVLTIGERSKSALSSTYFTLTSKANTAPIAPVITAPIASQTTYNPNPLILVTLGTDAEGNLQTLTAAGYTASSTGNLAAGKKILLKRAVSFTAPGAGSVSVTASDIHGAASSAASRSYQYSNAPTTDATLVAGTTPVKAVHMTELRTAVNTIRAYYGLSAKTWSEGITAGATMLASWRNHVLELRLAMDEVIAYVNGWDTASSVNRIAVPSWVDIPVNKPTVAVMNQLRQVLKTL